MWRWNGLFGIQESGRALRMVYHFGLGFNLDDGFVLIYTSHAVWAWDFLQKIRRTRWLAILAS